MAAFADLFVSAERPFPENAHEVQPVHRYHLTMTKLDRQYSVLTRFSPDMKRPRLLHHTRQLYRLITGPIRELEAGTKETIHGVNIL